MIPDLNHPVLYACVAHGATVLAELVPGGGGGGDVAAVALQCLAAAPPFHREYSHTAGGRIYAFAMADPLVFFAIADASLGAPRAFLFLRRLHRSAAASTALGGAAAAPLSLHLELLPELRRLALALPDEVDDPPPPSPSPSPPPPPTTPSPLNEANNEPPKPGMEEEKKRKKKKKKKKHPSDEGDGAMEISVAADAADPLPKSMRIAWRRHLRAILLVDLAFCGLLFGIWISVCKGFHCIRR